MPIGSNFDEFLKEEGIYEVCNEGAIKKVLAWQIEEEMKAQHLTKSEMARRMHTSRAVVDRLLDAGNPSVTLSTLTRAVSALGKRLVVSVA